MTMYVFSTGGEPVGFVFGAFVHDLSGTPLGRIVGSRVHRLDGSYVGEWFKEMVVERPLGRSRTIHPIPPPRRQPPVRAEFVRRGVIDYGYPDMFTALYHRDTDALAIAAE